MAQHRRRDHRAVLDAHAVMHLVALLQPAQDADGVFHAWLVHEHRLEAPFQRRVLLDVLAILVQCGRANRPQLAARQHRLEHVAGVHRALGSARADNRVQLVQEQDDTPVAVGHFLQHRLQPLLELAAILRAGHQRAHIQRDNLLIPQPFRHVAVDNALRQPFDDGRLANARLADEHRVVLGAAADDLDNAPDFVVAPDHRVELARPRQRCQIAPVLFERLERALRVLAGDALATANRLQRLQNRRVRDAVPLQHAFDRRFIRECQQQMLGAHVIVPHPVGFFFRLVEHVLGGAAQARLGVAAGDARAIFKHLFDFAQQRLRAAADLGDHLRRDALILLHQRRQQVQRVQAGMAELGSERLRAQQRFLGFIRIAFQVWHMLRNPLRILPIF